MRGHLSLQCIVGPDLGGPLLEAPQMLGENRKPIYQELICMNVLLGPTQTCVGACKETPDFREGQCIKD